MSLELKHLELFSGIGGFRYALELLSKDFGIKQSIAGFSEIDKYAIKTYEAAFVDTGEPLGDIVAYNNHETDASEVSGYNLLTGGFPCQPFSAAGKELGFKEVTFTTKPEVMKVGYELYKRMGFEEVGEKDGVISMRMGL